MKQPTQTKNNKTDDEERAYYTAAEEPPAAVSLEEALSVCCVPSAPAVASLHEHANAGVDADTTQQANTGFGVATDKEGGVAGSTIGRSTLPLSEEVVARIPGAYHVPGPGPVATANSLDEMVEEQKERSSVSATTSFNIEREDQQQSAQTNIVSAYRVAEEEPAIIATPFNDKKFRFLIYGVLVTTVVGLIVGLSVGLTTKNKKEKTNDKQGQTTLPFTLAPTMRSAECITPCTKASDCEDVNNLHGLNPACGELDCVAGTCQFEAWENEGDCLATNFLECGGNDALCTKGPSKLNFAGTCTGFESNECVYRWCPGDIAAESNSTSSPPSTVRQAKCSIPCTQASDCNDPTNSHGLDQTCGDLVCVMGACQFEAWKNTAPCAKTNYIDCHGEDDMCIKGPSKLIYVGTCTGFQNEECVYRWCPGDLKAATTEPPTTNNATTDAVTRFM